MKKLLLALLKPRKGRRSQGVALAGILLYSYNAFATLAAARGAALPALEQETANNIALILAGLWTYFTSEKINRGNPVARPVDEMTADERRKRRMEAAGDA